MYTLIDHVATSERGFGYGFSDVVSAASSLLKANVWYFISALLRRLVAGFPPRRPGFEPGSGHVGIVVDKVALGQVFSVHFGFPCQSSFH
jgi:hypothetical protein